MVAFGTATAAVQGAKTVSKVAAAFTKFSFTEVAIGWGSSVGFEVAYNMGLPPQMVFLTHIGVSVAVGKKSNIQRVENIADELGLQPGQVKDVMKYTGSSISDFEKIVKKGNLDDILKGASGAEMPEISSKFNYKSKYDEVEFTTQLKNQEKGLNDLTISEFVENRKKYKEVGRSKEASKLQKELREKFRQDKIDELFASGTGYEDAVNEADKWMKKQAVLHDPDQIAGGNPLNLTGLGDKNINSSIGSQWRYRIDDLEKQIMDFANTIPKSEWGNVKLNIKLTY